MAEIVSLVSLRLQSIFFRPEVLDPQCLLLHNIWRSIEVEQSSTAPYP